MHDLALPRLTWLGVDIGQKRDRAAVAAVRPREVEGERHFDVMAKVWTPPKDGTAFDIAVVRAFIRLAAQHLEVAEVVYDPWRFEESAQVLADEGIPMTEFNWNPSESCPASEALYADIVAARVHHDGDRTLAAHVGAGAITQTERGWRISKRKASKPIDALAALLMGHWGAGQGDGERSMYDSEDATI